jgi:hypothetical protein
VSSYVSGGNCSEYNVYIEIMNLSVLLFLLYSTFRNGLFTAIWVSFRLFNYEFHLLNILQMMKMMKWNCNYEVPTSMFQMKDMRPLSDQAVQERSNTA